MKKITALFLLLCLIFPFAACENLGDALGVGTSSVSGTDTSILGTGLPSDYKKLLSGKKVLEVRISIEESDYAALMGVPSADTYYPATVNIDGAVSTTAGIKIKGNTDYVDEANGERYSFKLKFDKYMKGSKLLGLDELCLNNAIYDPSFVREFLTYKLLAEIGGNAPLASFAAVYVNDSYVGLYTAVEAIDNSYLDRVFGGHSGELYKANRGCTLQKDEVLNMEMKKGSDASGYSAVAAMIDALAGEGNIADAVNVSSVLKYIAANAVIANTDSYLGKKAQNFYFYNQNGKLQMIPWDYNLAFGTDTSLRKTEYAIDKSLISADVTNPYFNTLPESRPLISALLEDETYYAEYLSYIKTLFAYLDTIAEELTAYRDMIKDYVESDTTKFYTYNDFLSEFDGENPNSLAYFINARNEAIKAQIAE